MNYSTKTVRALNTAQIARLAPSVYSTEPIAGVSDRYQFVSTSDIIARLADVGYVVANVSQSHVREASGTQYAKHMVRMMHEKYLGKQSAVGDVFPQVLLTNSHNRTSAFHLSAGLYRLVCSNGMAAQAGNFASIRVLHNDARINDLVIEGANQITALTESTVMPKIEQMSKVELTAAQELQFAEGATVLKYGQVNTAEANLLLACRRDEDAARNMWAVLNRVQENAVKGGYETRDAAGRTVVARGIKSVTKDYDFNLKLWQMADRALTALTA